MTPMRTRFRSGAIRGVLVALLGGPIGAQAAEDVGPEILIEPILRAEVGSGVVISAEITDPQGVFEPKLYFRAIGETKYLGVPMVPVGGDSFRGEIPSTSVVGPMEYYVEAFDRDGNGPARSAPPTRPHRLFVASGPEREQRAVAPESGPGIVHTVVERAPQGRGIPIEASFRGPRGVFNPVVHFRRIGSAGFTPLSMAELPRSASGDVPPGEGVVVGTAGTGRFVAEIPSAFTNGDVEYFLEAMDAQGNGPSRHGTREAPHVIRTHLAEPVIDPDVALVACRELPREGETVQTERLGPCRHKPPELPMEALSRYGLGEMKLRYDNYPDAVAAFEEATRVAPKWPAAWFRLAQAAEAHRDFHKARDAYHAYVELAGRPPEFEALLKRMASVEYELDLAQRDAQEAAARESEQRAREDEKRRAREQVARNEEERTRREMLLSTPTQFLFLDAGTAAYPSPDGIDESGMHVALRVRLKWPGYPFLFGGVGLGFGSVTTAGGDARITAELSPHVGLNLLALPVPRVAGFTLLSPFVMYQPRILLSGALPSQSATGSAWLHTLNVGNHFEFGPWSAELAWGFGILGSSVESQFVLSLGRRLFD